MPQSPTADQATSCLIEVKLDDNPDLNFYYGLVPCLYLAGPALAKLVVFLRKKILALHEMGAIFFVNC